MTQTSMGKIESSLIQAPEAQMTLSGQGRLQNGEAFVAYGEAMTNPAGFDDNGPPEMMKRLSEDIFSDRREIRVIITPTAACNGLYVAEKTGEGFLVKELMNGTSDATFDWMSIGSMKGQERDRINKRFIVEEPQPTLDVEDKARNDEGLK